jgi:multidrug efflux system membrane fusion protein
MEASQEMNLETKEKKRSRAVGWVVAGVVVLGLIFWWGLRGAQGDRGADAGASGRGAGPGRGKGGAQTVPVAIATAERRDVPVYLTGLGTVTAVNTVTIKSRVDGQIVGLPFREGQDVHKGDLLVVIDPRPFEVQVRQSESNLAKDRALLADARANLARFEDLFRQGIVSQQQLDTQRAQTHQLEGAAGVDQGQLDNARLQLTYSRITAPIDGRIGLRQVDVGNMVHANDQNGILVITQLDPMGVVFTLPEDNLQQVARRMRAGTLAAEAYSRDDRTKLATGTLVTMDNQIDTQTGTGRLKAVFANTDRALWPNQFVNVRLRLEVRKDQTVVPAAALQRGAQGTFAYVVKPDQTVENRAIKVSLVQGDWASIDQGVAPGDVVVTDGQEKLQSGSKVEARTPGAGGDAQGQGQGQRGQGQHGQGQSGQGQSGQGQR